MKIVLSYGLSIKLYTDELTYNNLMTFASKQMNLKRQSISLLYTDADQDQISICNDEDISILETLFQGESYVKIQVEGEPQGELEFAGTKIKMTEQPLQLNESQSSQDIEKLEIRYTPQQEQKTKQQLQLEKTKQNKRTKKITKEKIIKPLNKYPSFEQFSQLITEIITGFVDQRVNALVTGMKEQIDKTQKETEHNIQDKIKELYDKFFNGRVKKEVEKFQKITRNQRNTRFCRDLKAIFGGNQEDYKKLVEDNQSSSFPVIIDKLCDSNPKLDIEESKQRYKNFLSKKMSKKFKKEDRKDLNQFIEQNYKLQYKEIEKLYSEKIKGLAKEQKQIQNIQKKKEKQERLLKIKEEKKEKQIRMKEEIEQKRIRAKEDKELRLLKQKEERSKKKVEIQKIKTSSLLETKNEDIYQTMIEICGEEHKNLYPEFIEKHSNLARQNIIEKWLENFSNPFIES